jgi:hypothetical protein
MMLCNRKCTKGTVKHMSRSGYTTLVHQELAVVKPNSWHLGYKETMQQTCNLPLPKPQPYRENNIMYLCLHCLQVFTLFGTELNSENQ